MFDGFFYLLAQTALLLIAAAVLGLLIGRFLWPRHPAAAVLAEPQPLTGAEPALAHLEQRLATSEAEVENLRVAVTTIEDRKEAEMGRLESGAIEALDSLIATHQRRQSALETQLQTAKATARYQERELEAERRRSLRLQAALTERDERIAALTADIAERDRQLGLLPEGSPASD
jgi:chromosome segregation ATPase